MTVGFVDTTILVHVLRNNAVALAWFNARPEQLSITPISWMEIMDGAGSKRAQRQSLDILNRFEIVYLTEVDMKWAMQQLEIFRLSHGSHTMDCLIASVCHRLQVPLYTHNIKDMSVLLGPNLTVKPY
jgi:predicted nucleic acid-binding protein